MSETSPIDRLKRAVGLQPGDRGALEEQADTELDIGLDAEAKAGTGERDTGTGPDYDYDEGPKPGEHERRPG